MSDYFLESSEQAGFAGMICESWRELLLSDKLATSHFTVYNITLI